MTQTPPPPGPMQPTKFCRRCLYPLDGLPSARCPECGGSFDPGDAATFLLAPIPPTPWQCTWALRGALAIVLFVPVSLVAFIGAATTCVHPPKSQIWLGYAFLATLPLLAILTLLTLVLGIVGITRPGLYRRRRGWIALAVAAPLAAFFVFLAWFLLHPI
jgi:hypothetical protein